MRNMNVIRAWKDEEYRAQLTPEELAYIPANPAGLIELQEDQLRSVTGGEVEPDATAGFFSTGCCGGLTANTWCWCSQICSFTCIWYCFA